MELEKIILSERKNVPIEFPVIDRKRLLQLVKENQLQLDENELPHAVHFLNESGLCVFFKIFQNLAMVICTNESEPCYNLHSIFNRIASEFFSRTLLIFFMADHQVH